MEKSTERSTEFRRGKHGVSRSEHRGKGARSITEENKIRTRSFTEDSKTRNSERSEKAVCLSPMATPWVIVDA